MADEVPESVDLWDVLEEAEQTVERWPAWQRRYDADDYYDEDAPGDAVLRSLVLPPALVWICVRAAVGAVH
ncbi:MAG TPA: hypothetical protein VF698_04495 [Thermoanaerobaculia bacterium]|jgi:hypothetical protein